MLPTSLIAVAFKKSAEYGQMVLKGMGKALSGGDRRSLRLTLEHESLVTRVVELAGAKTTIGIECSGPVILPKSVRQDAAAILIVG